MRANLLRRLVSVVVLLVIAPAAQSSRDSVLRIDHVADGDTITLTNRERVRLVQIDRPEVYFGTECYGPQASAITKRLLPPGTAVRPAPEPGGVPAAWKSTEPHP